MSSVNQILNEVNKLQIPDCVKNFIVKIFDNLEIERKKELIKKILEELGISIDESEIKIENGKIYVEKEWNIPHIICNALFGNRKYKRCYVKMLLIEGKYGDETWYYVEYRKPYEFEVNNSYYYFTLYLKLEGIEKGENP